MATAPTGIYLKLQTRRQEFRLLTLLPGDAASSLCCTLDPASLHSPPAYEALSYCWGDVADRRSIIVSSKTMSVTANLFLALKRLRDPVAPRTLWVDAVCINQDDLDERTEQVALMTLIYQSGTRVVIWLGESTPGSSRALKMLPALDTFLRYVADTSRPGISWEELVQRPWFSRVWVIQELAFAKSGIFICGEAEVDVDEVEQSVCRSLAVIGERREMSSIPPYLAVLDQLFSTRTLVRRNWKNAFDLGAPFYLLLEKHDEAKSTDPRDKIFALLGMSKNFPGPEILASYHLTTQQVFAMTVKRWIYRYENLDILTTFLGRHERVLHLPSWVPDWSGPCPERFHAMLNSAPPKPTTRRGAPFCAWQTADAMPLSEVQPGGGEKIAFVSWGHRVADIYWNVDLDSRGLLPGATEDAHHEATLSSIRNWDYSRYLTLEGCFVDAIPAGFVPNSGAVSALLRTKNSVPPTMEGAYGARVLHMGSGMVWSEVFALVEPNDLDLQPYVTGGSRLDAFLKTLAAGYPHTDKEGEEERGKMESLYREYMLGDRKKFGINAAAWHRGISWNMRLHLYRTLDEWQFVATAQGYYALVPPATRAGDIIVLLVGGVMPFVLRRKYLGGTTEETTVPSPFPDPIFGFYAPEDHSTGVGETDDEEGEEDPEWEEDNYAGTSRKPNSPLIASARRHGQAREIRFAIPKKVDIGGGKDFYYDPSWEVVGIAYVQGIMHGEMANEYEKGKASLQTFLIV